MADEVELAIRMTADARDATAALDSVGDSADAMASNVDAASRKVDDAGSRMTSAADSADELGSKSSQAAGGLGDLGGALAQVPGPLGAVGTGMETLAPSVMGVTGAADLLNLAMSSNVVVTGKAKAAAAAKAVTDKVVTASTKAWAAGQWLLNAALSANPIGVVIALVALLVGGIVLAYQRSETFRSVVDKAMGAARTAIGFVVDKAKAVAGPIQDAIDKLPSFSGAFETAKRLVTGYLDLITAPLRTVVDLFQSVIDKVQWLADHGGKLTSKALDMVGLRTVGGGVVTGPTAAPVAAVAGPQVFITVQGAIDPYATAQQIIQLLRRVGVEVTGVAA